TKAQNAAISNATGLWVSATSILISLASLIVNILN
ncbi:MAG: polysaccharide export protein, partial [Dysgonamonadaceae bacterium]